MGLLAALKLPPVSAKAAGTAAGKSPEGTSASKASRGAAVAAPGSAAPSSDDRSFANGGRLAAGGAPLSLPGIDPGIVADAARAAREKAAAPPLAFVPTFEFLTPVSMPYPTMLTVGEEKTIDIYISNWSDYAPEEAKVEWSVSSNTKSVKATIEGDAQGRAYLTVTGSPHFGPAVVSWQAVVDYKKRKTSFPGTAITFAVGPPGADQDDSAQRLADGGGPVSAAQLEQDVTNLLMSWESAAKTGVAEFATQELEKKIDDISKGDWTVWATALAGNLLWAATVFELGGKTVVALAKSADKAWDLAKTQKRVSFVLSLAGIGVPAALTTPSGSSTPTVAETQIMLDRYVMNFHQNAKKKLGPQLRALALGADMSRYEAAGKAAQAIFKPGSIHVDGKYQILPTVNEAFIADRHRKWASMLLEKYVKEGKKTALEHAWEDEERKSIKANRPIKKL